MTVNATAAPRADDTRAGRAPEPFHTTWSHTMTEQPVGPHCGNNPNVRLTDHDRKAVADFKARLTLQAAVKPYVDAAAWVDGDPLMEVIAATVWKHCARDDQEMPQAVCDDPRTIAAFATAVARAHAAAAPSSADRAAVERVRAVLETEAVVGRSALEYRGLIVSALMAAEAQQQEPAAETLTDAVIALHAETGWHTPGCDCGHDGMGPKWHAKACAWLATMTVPHPDDVAQQQPDIGARAEEPPTEEQMVRDHVTTLHLIGEQLTRVEAWMWAHLADVRDAQAATAAPVAQQPAAEAEQDDTVHSCPGRWGGPNCRCFDAEPAPAEQQAAAADGEETPSRAVLLELVRDFLDADPCSFDHHGYCQAHGWLGGEPGSCPHGRARKLIPGIDEDTAP